MTLEHVSLEPGVDGGAQAGHDLTVLVTTGCHGAVARVRVWSMTWSWSPVRGVHTIWRHDADTVVSETKVVVTSRVDWTGVRSILLGPIHDDPVLIRVVDQQPPVTPGPLSITPTSDSK